MSLKGDDDATLVVLRAGLQILYTLLQNVAQEDAAAQSFYQTYFCDILQHIFSVVTDTSHTAGKSSCPVVTSAIVKKDRSAQHSCVWQV